MFESRLEQASILKKILEAIKELVNEANVCFFYYYYLDFG
jgi:hypothetical protein